MTDWRSQNKVGTKFENLVWMKQCGNRGGEMSYRSHPQTIITPMEYHHISLITQHRSQ